MNQPKVGKPVSEIPSKCSGQRGPRTSRYDTIFKQVPLHGYLPVEFETAKDAQHFTSNVAVFRLRGIAVAQRGTTVYLSRRNGVQP